MITHKTKYIFVNFLLFLFAFSFSIISTSAQEIWQVDSRIEKMSVKKSGGYYILLVTIVSNNDDDTRSPKLIVSIPRNCKVTGIKMPAGFESTAYQIYGTESQVQLSETPHIDSYIKFDLKNLPTTTNSTFRISFKVTSEGLRRNSAASAFIYSVTPEANKSNNFAVVNVD